MSHGTHGAPVPPTRFGWLRDLAKFGIVGGFGLVTDLVVFNVMLAAFPGTPIRSRILAVALATVVTYLGHRHWTWSHRSRAASHREVVVFFVLNGIGLGIGLLSLYVSHYVLDLTSQLSDNISSYLVGAPLGGLFRWWSYQRFIFKHVA